MKKENLHRHMEHCLKKNVTNVTSSLVRLTGSVQGAEVKNQKIQQNYQELRSQYAESFATMAEMVP